MAGAGDARIERLLSRCLLARAADMAGQARFRMLEVVRQFAAEQADPAVLHRAWLRHFAFHVGFTREPQVRAVKTRSTYRQEQAAATRDRIADAARRLFASSGYGSTSIEAIAAEAGVAVRTVYSSFRTKREILSHICERWLKQARDHRKVPALDR